MMEKHDITCSICLHDRKQPKILTCLHVYCCQCLSDYVNKSLQDGQFPCPLCRQQIQLPSGGVDDFPDYSEGDVENGSDVDDVVNTTTETDNVSEMTVVPPARTESLCDVCENKTIVKFRCKDCKQSICDSCKKTHDKFPFMKNHVVVDVTTGSDEVELLDDGNHDNLVSGTIVSNLDMCPVHPSKPIEIYCVNCQESVCLQCFVDETNRGVHIVHTILNLGDTVTQTKLRDDLEGLNTELQVQIDRLQEFSDDLESKLSEIDMCSEEACNKVDQQVQIISKLIQSRAEQLKTRVNQTRNKQRNKLEKLKKEMEISISKLKSDIEHSLIILKGKSVVNIVERSEINRNDEMEVKDKDLFLPDLELPSFTPRTDVGDEIENLFGECHNLQLKTFTLDFNLPTIFKDYQTTQEEDFDFDDVKGYVAARSSDNYLGVFLYLVNLQTRKNSTIKVEYSFTLLNKLAGESQTRHRITHQFHTGGDGCGYQKLISLKVLEDPENDFVDEDGNFSISVSIQEVKSE